MKRPDDLEVQAWLEKATEDLAAARVLERHAPHLDTVVGFHCQQAMEKSFKAVLVAMEMDTPKTHDLDALLALLITRLPELEALKDAASYLNGFSVIPRYPTFQACSGDPEARSHRACALASKAEKVFIHIWDSAALPPP